MTLTHHETARRPGARVLPFKRRAEPTSEEVIEPEPAPARGPLVRTSARAARAGRYAPRARPAPTTTRQGEVLNPALIAAPLDDEGVAIGTDTLSKAPVAHDPFTAYRKKELTSPSVIAIGVIGSGKSSLLKTVYLLRPMILKGRRGVTLDRKDRDGQGEYAELTERFGGDVFRMVVGGGPGSTTLNPLDPRILDVMGAAGQYLLVKALAERATGQSEAAGLDSWQSDALRVTFRRLLRDLEGKRAPVLEDLTVRLGVVDGVEEWGDYSLAARERMHQGGLEVRQLLNGVMADELAGLFDGETSANVELNSRLTTFDISQLPQDGPATAMVVGVAQAWLLGTLRKDRGLGTNFLVEEGWDMVRGPIAKQINANQMLARGLGLSNVAALHHLSQIPPGSEAESLVKEPQTIHLFRQDRDVDAQACVAMFNLDPAAGELLKKLPQGHHLLKIGSRPEIHVEHVRSPLEVALTHTDSGMNRGE